MRQASFHEIKINCHKINNSHEMNCNKINSHEINLSQDQLNFLNVKNDLKNIT